MKKTLITILATVLVCCCVVGGTLAWLVDQTYTVTNTFTVGNVQIELTETNASDSTILNATEADKSQEFKMVPGNVYLKDPTITVKAESESCYVFVKIEENNNPKDFLDYEVRSGWQTLTGVTGVYYQLVESSDEDQLLYVLAGGNNANRNGQVTVKSDVTQDALNNIVQLPTLTFTAYAVQADNLDTAAAAWTAGGFN